MANKPNPLSNIRLVCRKSSPLTKIVVSAAVVLSMTALLTLHAAIDSTAEQTAQLRAQALILEQDNARLRQYIAERGTVQEVVRIAQERLGLTAPDSIVIQPEKMEEAN